MAERIQLKEPGSELVMVVGAIQPETVEKNDYYRFSNGKVELLVPQSSVKAQFERLGIFDVNLMIGKTVRFGRSMKMSRANKPFWDIDWASGAEAPSQSAGGEMGKPNAGTPSAAPSAELVSDDARDKALLAQRAVYATRMKQSVAYVLENIEPLYKAKGIGMTDDGVYKHAYSIWQEWCERGIIQ